MNHFFSSVKAGHGFPRLPRRAFLKTTLAGAGAGLLFPQVWAAEKKPSPPDNREILNECPRRIEQHRKGDGIVVVLGKDRKPMANVPIRIEQVRHDVLFGCNFFRFARLKDPALEEAYRRRFTELLNYATLPFYWASYERERGKPEYDYSKRTVEWCREHGVTCKGHPLAWDHPAGNPQWLPADLNEVGRLSHERTREIIGRFKGQIEFWDVVNEAVHLGQANQETRMAQWAKTLGARTYVREHLEMARQANPQATLLVNDYRLDRPYYELLDALRGPGGKLLYDAVGLQSHMHDHPWPLHQVWGHCDTYARLGLPLHFTEATVVSGPRTGPGENWGSTTPELEQKQADYVAGFYTALFAHPAVQAVTWWDFSDNGAWQRAAAGLVRADMSPKPVYDRLLGLIKGDWWTKTKGRTDAQGQFATRAFYGIQKITAELPNGRTPTLEVYWQRGQANRFEFVVG